MESEGIIDPQDRKKIEEFRGNMASLDIKPTFAVYRDWDLDTLIALEKEGQLAAHVKEALAVPLATWGETLADA